jgi:hypothetical protein
MAMGTPQAGQGVNQATTTTITITIIIVTTIIITTATTATAATTHHQYDAMHDVSTNTDVPSNAQINELASQTQHHIENRMHTT